MWIKEIPNNYIEEKSFAVDAIFLWKSDNHPIYVMDNHLCATWCWLQECDFHSSYNFMHIDQHSDLASPGDPSIISFLRENPHVSFKEYKALTIEKMNYPFFKWDNYIRACQYLFPNWFSVNMFCTQEINDFRESILGYKRFPIYSINYIDVCKELTQYINEPSENLSPLDENWKNKWILNIDLDFFWTDYKIKLLDDEFIRDLARRINNAIDNIEVITIALSPDCVGGREMKERWANAFKALDIFKEEIDGLGDFTTPC